MRIRPQPQRPVRRRILVSAVLVCAACATDELRPDYESARALVRQTTGVEEVHDPEGPPSDPQALEQALSDGLGRDEAVRLALLHNRRLQAGFMELGIARADFVQAGLLENPTLGLQLLFPAGSGRSRTAANLAMGVADVWRLPERQRTAEAAMEQTLLELGRLAGRLVADTRAAYARAVAARAVLASTEQVSELATDAAEALAAQASGGVATDLQLQAARGDALSAELATRTTRREAAEALRHLGALLSYPGDLEHVTLLDDLDPHEPSAFDVEALVGHALDTRLDLRALRAGVRAAEARLALEHARAGPDVRVGVGYERPESDDPTDHVLGPTLGVELPIFDGNEAQVSRAAFTLERQRRLLEAAEAEVAQQVRASADALAHAAGGSRLAREQVLPQAERTAALVQHAFDQGHATTLDVLQARRAVARARSLGVESALDAVLARSDLELALGGPWPGEPGAPDEPGEPDEAVAP